MAGTSPGRMHGRHRQRIGVISALCVVGLVTTSGLPAFASELSEGVSPTLGSSGTGEQRLSVSSTVTSQAAQPEEWLRVDGSPAWVAPVRGELRDRYGPRLARPVAGVSGLHRGQDLGAGCGRRVRAASDGVVVQAGWFGTYGNWILIDHGNGVTTGYAHNGSLSAQVGDQVRSGQVIALAGTTGASSGCHVHLEVRSDQNALDPVEFMRQRGVSLG